MATYDRFGNYLLRKARNIPENVHVSKQAAELAEYTGLIGQDIDGMKLYTASRDLAIIARLPDLHANAYVEDIIEETMSPKNSEIKTKTGPYGTLKSGNLVFVSDTDLMCMHRFDRRNSSFSPIISDWDGKRPMNEIEKDYLGNLNHLLISKAQHGCNDNYVSDKGRPINTHIGNEFISIVCGHIEIVNSIGDLKSHYDFLGLENWHPEYEISRPSS